MAHGSYIDTLAENVLDNQNNVIYDFKFGTAKMSKSQFNKYHNTFFGLRHDNKAK